MSVKRFTPAAALLVLGGVLMLISLALPWAKFAASDGTTASVSGYNASYDGVITAVLGVVLIVAGWGVASGRRWGSIVGIIFAILSCLWAAILFAAVKNLQSDALVNASNVTVAVAFGVYLIVAGAVLGLIGSILSFRRRTTTVAATGPYASA